MGRHDGKDAQDGLDAGRAGYVRPFLVLGPLRPAKCPVRGQGLRLRAQPSPYQLLPELRRRCLYR